METLGWCWSGNAYLSCRARTPPEHRAIAFSGHSRPTVCRLHVLTDIAKHGGHSHPYPRGARGRAQRAPGPMAVRADSEKQLQQEVELDCVGTGADVECLVRPGAEEEEKVELDGASTSTSTRGDVDVESRSELLEQVLDTALLISPFFFWGTAMVAMKDVLPKAGPLFVAATRLIPSGALLVGFAAWKGRKQPAGAQAWLAIALFGLVDAACFQGFLVEGLRRTSAGLGSVIIDSQPLTVAVLAALLFGESIGPVGAAGLATGVAGLLLLEVPPEALQGGLGLSLDPGWNLWESGEWWMLLAAQSMAVGTVMVRWVCKYSDPVMATGWHMILGGLPLLALSAAQHDPALSGGLQELLPSDWAALVYTSVFGSAVSYGVFFYNATRGSLTKLSSLTFLTPMFAALFGYLFLHETLTPLQLFGATVTLAAIYMVNAKQS